MKPPEYKQSYTQLDGEIGGLSPQQLADKHRPLDQAPASGDYSGTGGPGSGGTGTGSGAAHVPDQITPDPSLPVVTQDPKKQNVRLAVTLADARAYRGDVIHVEGRAEATGKPLPDHPIDVFLAPAGASGAHPMQLPGRVTTGPDGTFRVDLSVPAGVELKTYEIYLSSPEDAYYNAALSE
jgi:hypothetical protein